MDNNRWIELLLNKENYLMILLQMFFLLVFISCILLYELFIVPNHLIDASLLPSFFIFLVLCSSQPGFDLRRGERKVKSIF